tara:strand:+ start:840 stop:1106 length:267 start_codon:yes stop_codon:yes gene_type:complete
MFIAVLIALFVCFIIILVRLVAGRTMYDRVLAANSIGTIIVLGISIHGFFMGRPEFIDISIVYALINFIGTVAILKLFDKGTLGEIDD